MSSIEIAYRAAALEHEALRRKANKLGPILVEMREQKVRKPKTPHMFVAPIAEKATAARVMLAAVTRIRRLAEG